MTGAPIYSPLFDGLGVWLQTQGLHEVGIDEVVQGLGQRLVAGGLSMHRISVGGMQLHPVFGALDVIWEAEHDRVRSEPIPRSMITTREFQDSPFFEMAATHTPFIRAQLETGELEKE